MFRAWPDVAALDMYPGQVNPFQTFPARFRVEVWVCTATV